MGCFGHLSYVMTLIAYQHNNSTRTGFTTEFDISVSQRAMLNYYISNWVIYWLLTINRILKNDKIKYW